MLALGVMFVIVSGLLVWIMVAATGRNHEQLRMNGLDLFDQPIPNNRAARRAAARGSVPSEGHSWEDVDAGFHESYVPRRR